MPFPQVTVAARPAARRSSPAREQFSTANELDQDIIELTDDYTMVKGKHTYHGRHAQRVLQVQEPVHPRQLRDLPLLQPRQLRGGPGAAVRLQLLGDERPAAGREVRRQPVRLLRGRSVARAVERDAHLRPPRGQADVPGQADGQPGWRSPTSATRPTSCRRATMWSPRVGFNWDLKGNGDRADPRRHRPLRRPPAVRVDLEPVRQHRHRLHAHRRGEQHRATSIPFVADADNQPKTVTGAAAGTPSPTRST